MVKRIVLRATPWLPALVLVLVSGALFTVLAARSGESKGGDESRTAESRSTDETDAIFARGMELVREGKYREAMERFEQARKKDKKNPDIFNMIAYTQRKTGNLDDAFENYRKALGMRPKFPQAREYLGEAHIQAALLQIDILRDYGKDGEKELQQLVGVLRRAAETLSPDAFDDASKFESEEGW